jgi:molecular chaperone GrpE
MDSRSDENHPPEPEGESAPADARPEVSAAPDGPTDESGRDSTTEAEPGTSEGGEPERDAPPGETIESLSARVADLRSLADEYLDGWQRSRAEFANYKNRVKREEQEAQAVAAASVLARTLPLLDDLERALKDRPRQAEAATWADGIELIYRKWTAILESQGLEPIPAAGQKFDPTLHEALSHEESPDHKEGDVIEVIAQGYRIGDRVVRPALVRVAK